MPGRRPFFSSFVVLATALLALSCDSEGGSLTDTGNDVATVSGTGLVLALNAGPATIRATSEGKSVTADITVVDGGFVGPSGGTIIAAAGTVTLVLPPGALAQGAALTVAPLANPPVPASLIPGTAFSLGPGGTNFAQPVTVGIRYEPGNLPGGANPALFVVHRWNGTTWAPLGGTNVDQGTRLVSGQTTAFSPFALIQVAVQNPVPTLTALNPTSKIAGEAEFVLTVTGSNFVNGAEIHWNGVEKVTQFGSGSQLTATIPASGIAQAGQANVTIFNPGPGGGTSAALDFTILSGMGATVTVTTSSDSQGGGCSLRSAIEAANTNGPVDSCSGGSGAFER
ncbi:MAG: IPT/TIG domain-containing protein [Gemmatimonadota bacterium]